MNFPQRLGFIALLFAISHNSFSQEVEVIKFGDLEQMLNTTSSNDKVYNFWATWCGPCVKELPQFEALLEQYKTDGLEVILISMDFVESKSKVEKFMLKKKIKSKVYLLDETDYNSFIDKIEPKWSGAIPATIFINGRSNKRTFFEKEFKEGELEKAYIEIKN